MFIVAFDIYNNSNHPTREISEIKPIKSYKINDAKEYSERYKNYHKDYYHLHKEYYRNYYQRKKDLIKNYKREYYQKTKERHLLKLREYYQKNKEQIDAYNVNYRKIHRERILECNRQRYWRLKAEKEQLKLV